jgi:hypothetical protein
MSDNQELELKNRRIFEIDVDREYLLRGEGVDRLKQILGENQSGYTVHGGGTSDKSFAYPMHIYKAPDGGIGGWDVSGYFPNGVESKYHEYVPNFGKAFYTQLFAFYKNTIDNGNWKIPGIVDVTGQSELGYQYSYLKLSDLNNIITTDGQITDYNGAQFATNAQVAELIKSAIINYNLTSGSTQIGAAFNLSLDGKIQTKLDALATDGFATTTELDNSIATLSSSIATDLDTKLSNPNEQYVLFVQDSNGDLIDNGIIDISYSGSTPQYVTISDLRVTDLTATNIINNAITTTGNLFKLNYNGTTNFTTFNYDGSAFSIKDKNNTALVNINGSSITFSSNIVSNLIGNFQFNNDIFYDGNGAYTYNLTDGSSDDTLLPWITIKDYVDFNDWTNIPGVDAADQKIIGMVNSTTKVFKELDTFKRVTSVWTIDALQTDSNLPFNNEYVTINEVNNPSYNARVLNKLQTKNMIDTLIANQDIRFDNISFNNNDDSNKLVFINNNKIAALDGVNYSANMIGWDSAPTTTYHSAIRTSYLLYSTSDFNNEVSDGDLNTINTAYEDLQNWYAETHAVTPGMPASTNLIKAVTGVGLDNNTNFSNNTYPDGIFDMSNVFVTAKNVASYLSQEMDPVLLTISDLDDNKTQYDTVLLIPNISTNATRLANYKTENTTTPNANLTVNDEFAIPAPTVSSSRSILVGSRADFDNEGENYVHEFSDITVDNDIIVEAERKKYLDFLWPKGTTSISNNIASAYQSTTANSQSSIQHVYNQINKIANGDTFGTGEVVQYVIKNNKVFSKYDSLYTDVRPININLIDYTAVGDEANVDEGAGTILTPGNRSHLFRVNPLEYSYSDNVKNELFSTIAQDFTEGEEILKKNFNIMIADYNLYSDSALIPKSAIVRLIDNELNKFLTGQQITALTGSELTDTQIVGIGSSGTVTYGLQYLSTNSTSQWNVPGVATGVGAIVLSTDYTFFGFGSAQDNASALSAAFYTDGTSKTLKDNINNADDVSLWFLKILPSEFEANEVNDIVSLDDDSRFGNFINNIKFAGSFGYSFDPRIISTISSTIDEINSEDFGPYVYYSLEDLDNDSYQFKLNLNQLNSYNWVNESDEAITSETLEAYLNSNLNQAALEVDYRFTNSSLLEEDAAGAERLAVGYDSTTWTFQSPGEITSANPHNIYSLSDKEVRLQFTVVNTLGYSGTISTVISVIPDAELESAIAKANEQLWLYISRYDKKGVDYKFIFERLEAGDKLTQLLNIQYESRIELLFSPDDDNGRFVKEFDVSSVNNLNDGTIVNEVRKIIAIPVAVSKAPSLYSTDYNETFQDTAYPSTSLMALDKDYAIRGVILPKNAATSILKISDSDTSPDYLKQKLVAGTSINIVEVDNKLVISYDGVDPSALTLNEVLTAGNDGGDLSIVNVSSVQANDYILSGVIFAGSTAKFQAKIDYNPGLDNAIYDDNMRIIGSDGNIFDGTYNGVTGAQWTIDNGSNPLRDDADPVYVNEDASAKYIMRIDGKWIITTQESPSSWSDAEYVLNDPLPFGRYLPLGANAESPFVEYSTDAGGQLLGYENITQLGYETDGSIKVKSTVYASKLNLNSKLFVDVTTNGDVEFDTNTSEATVFTFKQTTSAGTNNLIEMLSNGGLQTPNIADDHTYGDKEFITKEYIDKQVGGKIASGTIAEMVSLYNIRSDGNGNYIPLIGDYYYATDASNPGVSGPGYPIYFDGNDGSNDIWVNASGETVTAINYTP